MKLAALLTLCDTWAENSIPDEAKLFLINQIEGRIQVEGMRLDPAEILQYGEADMEDEDLVLLVPPPYDELYRHYLERCIHYANGETELCNNASAAWNSAFLTFRDFWFRTHTPRREARALRLC